MDKAEVEKILYETLAKVAGILLDVIDEEHLDIDEVRATLMSWIDLGER